MDGKVSKFLQEHGFHIVCLLALCIGVAYGIHSCKNAVDLDINARRNSITISKTK